MKIPKKIKLFGCEYAIKQVNKVDDDNSLGKVFIDSGIIKLLKKDSKSYAGFDSIPEDKRKQVLLHELCHLMFYVISETELYNNEKIVDNMANCLMELIPQLEGK